VDVGVAVTVAVSIVRGRQIRRCLSGVQVAPRAEVIVGQLSVSVPQSGEAVRSGGSRAGALQRLRLMGSTFPEVVPDDYQKHCKQGGPGRIYLRFKLRPFSGGQTGAKYYICDDDDYENAYERA
jgi:hypothetical protein